MSSVRQCSASAYESNNVATLQMYVCAYVCTVVTGYEAATLSNFALEGQVHLQLSHEVRHMSA